LSERIPYVKRLREELVSAIAAKQTRSGAWNHWLAPRRWGRAAVAGAVAVVAVVLVLVVAGPLRGSPALAITHEDERATVRLLDPNAGVEAMERELEAAGIDGNVEEVAVSPSLVGRWMGASWLYGPPEDVPEELGGGQRWSGGSTDTPAVSGGGKTLRLPADGVYQLTLWLGRPAEPDEPYWVSGSAFAEQEPLHCSGVDGMRAVEAGQVVTRLGYEVSWFTVFVVPGEDRPGFETPGVEVNPVNRAPKGTVSGAEAVNRTKVRLFVVPDGEQAPWLDLVDSTEILDPLIVETEMATRDTDRWPSGPSQRRNVVSPNVRCGG
jgi:hypothetical protein